MATRIWIQAHQRLTSSLFCKRWEAARNKATPPHTSKRPFHSRIPKDTIRSGTLYSFASFSVDARSSTSSSDDDPQKAVKSESRSPKICILGGGFGGLYTAVKLDELMWPTGFKPEVTLIDQNDRFVFKPLLYDILIGAAEETEVAPFFRDLLEPFQTKFVKGRVMSVDVSSLQGEGGAVLLEDGTEIRYDWLVIAMGATTNFRGIPGVMQYAVPFNSFDDVKQITSNLLQLATVQDRRPQAVIVGGGYAGVELAAAVVTKINQITRGRDVNDRNRFAVTLITDTATILPTAPLSQRLSAETELKKDGVSIKTGCLVESMHVQNETEGIKSISLIPSPSVENDRVGETMRADLVMWTAGMTPSTYSSDNQTPFPFERTRSGSLITEPTLLLRKQKRVFALGDDAVIENSDRDGGAAPQLPATAQVAFQQADYVAWNLWAAINRRPLLPFRYQHLGDMMSLGTQNAAIAFPTTLPGFINDALRSSLARPLTSMLGLELGNGESVRDQRATLEGPLAVMLRRLAYWYRQPTDEQKAKIARHYFTKVAGIISSRASSQAAKNTTNK